METINNGCCGKGEARELHIRCADWRVDTAVAVEIRQKQDLTASWNILYLNFSDADGQETLEQNLIRMLRA